MYLGPAVMYAINLTVLFTFVIYNMIRVSPTLTAYVLIPLPILSFTIYHVSGMINIRSEKVQRQLGVLNTLFKKVSPESEF